MARSSAVSTFGRSKSFSKKQNYKQSGRKGVAAAPTETPSTKEVTFGKSKRTVPTTKASRLYPSEDVKKPKLNRKITKPASLRKSIEPGTVLILLAGRFRGKRVVFLKQLASGLLLVTGPFKLNGVPIRRVNQAYVIATSTKLDIAGVEVDSKLDDSYFRREKSAKVKAEASFFADPKNKAAHPESKVADQKSLDKALIASIKKAGPTMAKYLSATFSLTNGQRPHAMKF